VVSTLDESEHAYAVQMMKKGLMAHIATTVALKRMSHATLADLLDMERSHISELVSGKDDRFSIQHLVRICRTMGYGIDLHFYAISPKDR
jgi:predicted XRE-type DNA-binding protein